MHRRKIVFWLIVACLLRNACSTAQNIDRRVLRQLVSRLESAATQEGSVIGAQLAVGTTQDPRLLRRAIGRTGPGSAAAVDADTLFCIASCSKPIASACILRLAEQGRLDLDVPVSRYIRDMPLLQTVGGQAVQSPPSLRQILCHRGGFYSQHQSPSAEQISAIRDFSRTLEESARTILASPLDTQPGTAYAYSGAGYMIAGLATERATSETFESLLQSRICAPTGMQATTYFPTKLENRTMAIGGRPRGSELPAPHLYGSRLKLPLIGGSLYSTADDMALFAQMLLNEGKSGRRAVLGRPALREISRRQFADQPYGPGWLIRIENGRTARLSHNGSLYSYRSHMRIELQKKCFATIVYTLARPGDKTVDNALRRDINSLLNQL